MADTIDNANAVVDEVPETPTVETPVETTTTTPPVEIPTEAGDAETFGDGVGALVTDKKEEVPTETEAVTDELSNLTDIREGLIDTKETEVNRATDYRDEATEIVTNKADKTEEIITEADAKIQANLDAQKAQVDKAQADANEILMQGKASLAAKEAAALNVIEQEKALQAATDAATIAEAKVSQAVAQQRANWTFAKMGLQMSSGVVNQTQAIATEGANRLATIKVQASYNQAAIGLKGAEIMASFAETELEYDKAINDNINNALSTKLQIDNEIIARIEDVQKNLLINESEKAAALLNIKDNYRTDIKAAEDEFIANQIAISDKISAKAQSLEIALKEEEAEAKTDFQEGLTDGNYFLLSESEKAKLARKMGIEPADLVSNVNKSISSSIRAMYDGLVSPTESIPNRDALVAKVNSLMNGGGYTLERALMEAVMPGIKENETYKANQATAQYETNLGYRAAEADISKTQAGTQKIYSDINRNNVLNAASRAAMTQAASKFSTEGDEADAAATSGLTLKLKTGDISKLTNDEKAKLSALEQSGELKQFMDAVGLTSFKTGGKISDVTEIVNTERIKSKDAAIDLSTHMIGNKVALTEADLKKAYYSLSQIGQETGGIPLDDNGIEWAIKNALPTEPAKLGNNLDSNYYYDKESGDIKKWDNDLFFDDHTVVDIEDLK